MPESHQTSRKLDEKFLEAFLNAPSVSGHEQPAQRLFRQFVQPYVEEMTTDVMGNVITKTNSSGSPKIMLAGHCDEVGMQIRYSSEKGFLYFNGIGGLDAHLLPGARVQILSKNGPIFGVIGKKAIHLQEAEERKKVIPLKEQYIDIGARSREEVETMGIQIGDPAIFDYYYSPLGQNGDIVSRCFDDKIGGFIVAEIMKRLKEEQFHAALYGISTTQEEVGLRGAQTSVFSVEPDIALVYDVDFVMDTPSSEEKYHGRVKLGGGPIVATGPNMNPILFDLIVKTAEEMEIAIQIIAEPRGTGTDANTIQLSKSGVCIGLFGIPNRYMHSYSEIVNLQDVEEIICLSVEVIKRITPEMNFIPK
ncbi:MAG: M42 family peptidase [Promethearchaeota archaeon]|nr:MAG: M42 family peptidase [Candidatus Lokiarchaeota archaeon]